MVETLDRGADARVTYQPVDTSPLFGSPQVAIGTDERQTHRVNRIDRVSARIPIQIRGAASESQRVLSRPSGGCGFTIVHSEPRKIGITVSQAAAKPKRLRS